MYCVKDNPIFLPALSTPLIAKEVMLADVGVTINQRMKPNNAG